MRANSFCTSVSSRDIRVLSMRSAKNAMSSARSSSVSLTILFRKDSARSALSLRSAKATSGSIIQNSARWRLVFEFSARKVGPKV